MAKRKNMQFLQPGQAPDSTGGHARLSRCFTSDAPEYLNWAVTAIQADGAPNETVVTNKGFCGKITNCIYTHECVCMYVCTYVCMHECVCMCVCAVYVYVYVYVYMSMSMSM